jgi:hypothetical protein
MYLIYIAICYSKQFLTYKDTHGNILLVPLCNVCAFMNFANSKIDDCMECGNYIVISFVAIDFTLQ